VIQQDLENLVRCGNAVAPAQLDGLLKQLLCLGLDGFYNNDLRAFCVTAAAFWGGLPGSNAPRWSS